MRDIKNKEYYTKPVEEGSRNSQYLVDLENGLIKIYEVPFEYRTGLAYVLARKALRYEMFGKEQSKIERKLLAEQLKADIMECGRRKEDLSLRYPEPYIKDRLFEFLSMYGLCVEEKYIQLPESNMNVYLNYGVEKLLKI